MEPPKFCAFLFAHQKYEISTNKTKKKGYRTILSPPLPPRIVEGPCRVNLSINQTILTICKIKGYISMESEPSPASKRNSELTKVSVIRTVSAPYPSSKETFSNPEYIKIINQKCQ